MDTIARIREREIPLIIDQTIEAFLPLLEHERPDMLNIRIDTLQYGPTDRHKMDLYYPPFKGKQEGELDEEAIDVTSAAPVVALSSDDVPKGPVTDPDAVATKAPTEGEAGIHAPAPPASGATSTIPGSSLLSGTKSQESVSTTVPPIADEADDHSQAIAEAEADAADASSPVMTPTRSDLGPPDKIDLVESSADDGASELEDTGNDETEEGKDKADLDTNAGLTSVAVGSIVAKTKDDEVYDKGNEGDDEGSETELEPPLVENGVKITIPILTVPATTTTGTLEVISTEEVEPITPTATAPISALASTKIGSDVPISSDIATPFPVLSTEAPLGKIGDTSIPSGAPVTAVPIPAALSSAVVSRKASQASLPVTPKVKAASLRNVNSNANLSKKVSATHTPTSKGGAPVEVETLLVGVAGINVDTASLVNSGVKVEEDKGATAPVVETEAVVCEDLVDKTSVKDLMATIPAGGEGTTKDLVDPIITTSDEVEDAKVLKPVVDEKGVDEDGEGDGEESAGTGGAGSSFVVVEEGDLDNEDEDGAPAVELGEVEEPEPEVPERSYFHDSVTPYADSDSNSLHESTSSGNSYSSSYFGYPSTRPQVAPPVSAVKRTGPRTLPVLFFFYGGGFNSGSRRFPPPRDLGYATVGSYFAHRGLLVIIPDYRLAPDATYPQSAEDLRDAILYVIENVPEADTNRMFIMAHSAGAAHAVTLLLRTPDMLAGTPIRQGIRGVILNGGAYSYPTAPPYPPGALAYYKTPEDIKAHCPQTLFEKGENGVVWHLPPIYILMAENEPDAIKASNELFARTVSRRIDRKVERLVMKGHNHISANWSLSTGDGDGWGEDVTTWIFKHA